MYAKDKEDTQVEEVNGSLVNKLNSIIKSPRLKNYSFEFSGHKRKNIDCYKWLMADQEFEWHNEFLEITKKYYELSMKYHFKIDAMSTDLLSHENLSKSKLRSKTMYKKIIDETKSELSLSGKTDSEIADILIYFLFKKTNSKQKDLLWICYGDIMLKNLKNKIRKKETKEVQCVDCGEWFEIKTKDTKTVRCKNCNAIYRFSIKTKNGASS